MEASVEQALEAEREKTGWTVYLSLSTAIIAVFGGGGVTRVWRQLERSHLREAERRGSESIQSVR